MTRVLIIDDHESVCDSLAEAFRREPGYEVLPPLPSAKLAEAFCARLQPDLILMDVCTEGGASGLTAAEKLLRRYPELKVIVMSGFDEVTYAPRAREIGAQAFVYKTKSLSFFLEAARTVLAGGTCFPEPRKIPVARGENPPLRPGAGGAAPALPPHERGGDRPGAVHLPPHGEVPSGQHQGQDRFFRHRRPSHVGADQRLDQPQFLTPCPAARPD